MNGPKAEAQMNKATTDAQNFINNRGSLDPTLGWKNAGFDLIFTAFDSSKLTLGLGTAKRFIT